MSISEIVQAFEQIADRHKHINSFSFGESEDETIYGNDVYPRCFLELPFNVETNEKFKRYRIGMVISQLPESSSITDQQRIDIISECEDWASQIIFELKKNKAIQFSNPFSFSSLILINHTTDSSYGVRAEFEITVLNKSCDSTIFLSE
ncbi:hypothetical protein OKW21_006054 [Catalinimonas alkaloidigena]|uniref:hypothetical protein n=1 Tax=Catalinimonas alkaloidigena TaxID=1075417 RepID=UPI002405262E|nr:hypothetical protein [Catalinimonas alkaloidigena]MDF9800791.1 hypothetical protein [Catalinimonas alkaloidigena]